MKVDNSAVKSAPPLADEVVDFLDTEARLLAYLRKAMLESGDDPAAIAKALDNVASARAKLKAKGPLRVTAGNVAAVIKRLA